MKSNYSRLWLLVEGNDDERYAKSVLIPTFEAVYDHVGIWQYSQETIAKRANFLKSIHAMQADYLWFCDIDHFPCVSSCKDFVIGQVSALSADRIVVVVKEIEALHYAAYSLCQHRHLSPSATSVSGPLVVGGPAHHHPARPQCGQGARTTRRHSTPLWAEISCWQWRQFAQCSLSSTRSSAASSRQSAHPCTCSGSSV